MRVQTPLFGSVARTNFSESDSFPQPAIELSTMPCSEDVSKELLTGYSKNETLNDDEIDDDDDNDCPAVQSDEN